MVRGAAVFLCLTSRICPSATQTARATEKLPEAHAHVVLEALVSHSEVP